MGDTSILLLLLICDYNLDSMVPWFIIYMLLSATALGLFYLVTNQKFKQLAYDEQLRENIRYQSFIESVSMHNRLNAEPIGESASFKSFVASTLWSTDIAYAPTIEVSIDELLHNLKTVLTHHVYYRGINVEWYNTVARYRGTIDILHQSYVLRIMVLVGSLMVSQDNLLIEISTIDQSLHIILRHHDIDFDHLDVDLNKYQTDELSIIHRQGELMLNYIK